MMKYKNRRSLNQGNAFLEVHQHDTLMGQRFPEKPISGRDRLGVSSLNAFPYIKVSVQRNTTSDRSKCTSRHNTQLTIRKLTYWAFEGSNLHTYHKRQKQPNWTADRNKITFGSSEINGIYLQFTNINRSHAISEWSHFYSKTPPVP
jgi:hypothetical protein